MRSTADLHHTELDPCAAVPTGHLDVTLLSRLPDEDRDRPASPAAPKSKTGLRGRFIS